MGMALGPVGSYLTVAPTYDYTREQVLDRTDDRTRAGALYTYVVGSGYTTVKLPLEWVVPADRTLINSWWKSGSNVLFFEDSNQSSSFLTMRIVGVEEPFQTSIEPHYQAYYAGEIVMETV